MFKNPHEMSKPLSKRQRVGLVVALSACALVLLLWRPVALSQTETVLLRAPEKSRVNSVAFSPDGRSVVLSEELFVRGGASPAQVQIFDARSGDSRKIFSCANPSTPTYSHGWIGSAAFSRRGDQIVCATYPATVFDAKTGRLCRVLARADAGLIGIMPSPDGRFYAGSAGNAFVLWNANTGQIERTLKSLTPGRGARKATPSTTLSCAAFSPQGDFVVAGYYDGALRLWNLSNGTVRSTLSSPGLIGARGAGVTDVAFSPDAHTIAATDARHVWLWDARTAQLLRTWDGPAKVSVFGLSFSPDGKRLAGGGTNFSWHKPPTCYDCGASGPTTPDTIGEIDLWDVASGEWTHTLRAGYWIRHIIFSPDGQTLATSGDDNTARLWKVPS